VYTVEIDELVFSEDFKRIDGAGQKRIIKAVRKKLTAEPTAYGKPLSGQYKGFWKLKVGPYRVVYEILKSKLIVYVIKVGYRRDTEVYKELAKRLNI
jgi:mRNA interferase RelE/StbE